MVVVCSNCGGRGHLQKNCISEKECNCCGSHDHEKIHCPNKTKTCDLCFKVGHLKIKCDLMKGGGKGFGGKGRGKG